MIFLDSCILIYLIEAETATRRLIAKQLSQQSEVICTSRLSRLECLVLPTREHNDTLIKQYEQLFGALILLDMTAEVFDKAITLRAFHNLKTPDALQLATALQHNCTEFWTNDLRLRNVPSQITYRKLP